jgi:hypothetical protein
MDTSLQYTQVTNSVAAGMTLRTVEREAPRSRSSYLEIYVRRMIGSHKFMIEF